MKVTIKTLPDNAVDYDQIYILEINGKEIISFYDGEPEDNTLQRNFNDVYKIDKIIKMAFNAGKNGETLSIKYNDVDDI